MYIIFDQSKIMKCFLPRDKQKKITTQIQFEIMLEFLESHPEMVTGTFSIVNARISIIDLWKELKTKLNAEGPPMRDEEGWKKVWADLKNKIKKKLRKENTDRNQTGGGKARICLTPNDERIITLTRMDQCVFGVGGRSFGTEIDIQNENFPKISVEEATDNIELDVIRTPLTSINIKPTQTNRQPPKRQRLSIQRKMLDELTLQGKQNVQFQKSVVELMTEANAIEREKLKFMKDQNKHF